MKGWRPQDVALVMAAAGVVVVSITLAVAMFIRATDPIFAIDSGTMLSIWSPVWAIVGGIVGYSTGSKD